MALIVQKYGGTSLASIAHIKAIAKHIAGTVAAGNKVVAVVSAMGSQTDDLIALAHQVSGKPPPRELDMLLTVGERISMSLLSIALHDNKISSMSLTGSQSGILTDGCHGNARIQKVLGDRIREGLGKKDVVIIAGFQGMSSGTKEITTLGRGGTDLTATAIAHALKADSCQIYKDVDGICTADPDLVAKARTLKTLSWRGLADLTWAGAGVVHTRAAHLAMKYRIPIEIRSSFYPDREGTKIYGESLMESVTFLSLAQKKDQTLLTIDLPPDHGLIAKGLQWLWQEGETPLLHQHSLNKGRISLRQLVTTKLKDEYLQYLKGEAETNKQNVTMQEAESGLTAVSVIGEGFWQSPETVEAILNCLPEAPRFFDSRNSVITLCVAKSADALVQKLHTTFFEAKS